MEGQRSDSEPRRKRPSSHTPSVDEGAGSSSRAPRSKPPGGSSSAGAGVREVAERIGAGANRRGKRLLRVRARELRVDLCPGGTLDRCQDGRFGVAQLGAVGAERDAVGERHRLGDRLRNCVEYRGQRRGQRGQGLRGHGRGRGGRSELERRRLIRPGHRVTAPRRAVPPPQELRSSGIGIPGCRRQARQDVRHGSPSTRRSSEV